MAGKKTQGRKKIEMKKIENEDARRITFSKRRGGLFKKAGELSTLCGIQIAVIVYSIGGKAFSFGHPSVESVMNRFKNGNQPQQDYIMRCSNSIREARLRVLNEQFNDLSDEMANERKKNKMFKRSFKDFGCRSFEDYIDKLGFEELKHLKEKMQNLKEYLTREVNALSRQGCINPCHGSDLPVIEKKEVYGSSIPSDWLKL